MYFKNNCGHVFVDGSKVIVETEDIMLFCVEIAVIILKINVLIIVKLSSDERKIENLSLCFFENN